MKKLLLAMAIFGLMLMVMPAMAGDGGGYGSPGDMVIASSMPGCYVVGDGEVECFVYGAPTQFNEASMIAATGPRQPLKHPHGVTGSATFYDESTQNAAYIGLITGTDWGSGLASSGQPNGAS